LKPQPFDEPRLVVITAQELPLSGQALLELMRAVLEKGLPFRFRARGWSMAPFIQDGDVITVAPLRKTPAGIGEVVAFVRPGSGNLVVHRVVARKGDNLHIQGDGLTGQTDGMISPDNLLGRVTHIERNGRRVWLGLGPERYLVAWLSRARLLIPMRTWLAACRGRFS
jgi:Peptidase S24-like